jgi:exosortase
MSVIPIEESFVSGPSQGTPTEWRRLQRMRPALGVVVLAGLVLLIYYPVLTKLVTDWWQIPDFSHGFLIPPFAGYLIWARRDALRGLPLHQTWVGVGVVLLALLTLLLGVYGAELFLSRLSLVILLAGLTLTFTGPQHLKSLRFVFLLLLLAIPIPAILFNQITFPLQLLASKAAATLLPLFGIPVLREGNIIHLPSMRLEVAEACSGIRSLVSLFTVSILYGYFLEKSLVRRIVLAAASVPIAIAANAARIVGTGLCVQYWDPERAEGFFHLFSGWLIFVISLGMLYLVQLLLQLWQSREVTR